MPLASVPVAAPSAESLLRAAHAQYAAHGQQHSPIAQMTAALGLMAAQVARIEAAVGGGR